MTRDQEIRKAGGKFLMWLGLSQGLFILGVVISPFVWIFGTGLFALKVFIASIVGVLMIWAVYSLFYNAIGSSIDDMQKRKDRLFDQN